MKIRINRNECTGCEWCVDTLPDVFGIGEDHIAVIKNGSTSDKKIIQHVIDNCPAECIVWYKE
jgi:ferredoxin